MIADDAAHSVSTSEVGGGAAEPAGPATPQGQPPLSTEAAAGGIMAAGNADAVPVTTQEGVGTEGEESVWRARYSGWNFFGRFVGAILLTVGWAFLTYWLKKDAEGRDPSVVSWIVGFIVLAVWVVLLWRFTMARLGHFYELTNRRLFVSTGVFSRRRDQLELLRVQDVYVRQSMIQHLLKLGTVAIVSTEPHFPILYIVGIADPHGSMDRIWHYARAERDKRSVKVDAI